MSTDWREKEREFLTSLKADTGRDLGEWVRVIAAQNLPHRNDIIDWLRQQGFPFARASWLERIHHNQGRPIYLDPADLMADAAPGEAEVEAEAALQRVAAGGSRTVFMAAPNPINPTPAAPAARAAPTPRLAAQALRSITSDNEIDSAASNSVANKGGANAPPISCSDGSPPQAHAAVQVEQSMDGTPSSATRLSKSPEASHCGGVAGPSGRRGQRTGEQTFAIDEVLAKAKAYRPLAVHLMRMIESAIENVEIVPGPGHLLVSTSTTPFAIIAVSSKDIRLALRLKAGVACAPFGSVKLPATLARAAQSMTHMVVLTDARQLDEALINLVGQAAAC